VNLILAVVVECAAMARERDIQDKARLKATDQLETKKELFELCSQMDADGSGTRSKEELFYAYENMVEFSTLMMKLEVQADDLDALFRVLDADGSGDLDYEEFCDELVSLKSEDQQTLLILTRYAVQQIQHELDTKLQSKMQNLISASAKQEVKLEDINAKLTALCSSHLPQANEPSKSVDQPDKIICQLQAIPANTLSASPTVDAFDLMQQEVKCLASLNESLLQEVQLQTTQLNDQLKSLTYAKKQLLSASGTCESSHGDIAHSVQPHKDISKSKLIMTPLPQNMSTQVSLLNKCIQQNVCGAATVLEVNKALLSRVKQLVLDLPAAYTQACPSSLASLSVVSTV